MQDMNSKWTAQMRTWLWLAYIVALMLGSLLPVHMPEVPGKDKSLHTLAYAGLVVLWPPQWRRSWLAVWGLATLFGASMEIGQKLLPTGRTMELADAVANALGAGVGVILGWSIRRWVRLPARWR